MKSITEWLVDEKIAENGFASGHIAEGLKLAGLPREEQEKRCRLYRAWRPKTDKKNDIPAWQAYDLAIAGIDPDGVVERQIELFEVFDDGTKRKLTWGASYVTGSKTLPTTIVDGGKFRRD